MAHIARLVDKKIELWILLVKDWTMNTTCHKIVIMLQDLNPMNKLSWKDITFCWFLKEKVKGKGEKERRKWL